MSIYMDHNATTPVDPQVLDAMIPYMSRHFGNPSSVHGPGQRARRALDRAREQVAGLINAQPEEIVFTSGGTEADNQAILGTWQTGRHRGRHLLISSIEHPAVLEPARALERAGARVTWLEVDSTGIVDPARARASMGDGTLLLSVMAANNDVGTVQPVMALARAAAEKGVLFHCDAVQAAGRLPLDVKALGVDLLTISSHKIYGPKGAGALFVRSGLELPPLILGGHHESNRRAGTENVPAIVGFGEACQLAARRLSSDAARLKTLRERFESGLRRICPDFVVNGLAAERLPGTINVSFPSIDSEALLMALDMNGVAASAGSACTAGSREPSHVLAAMGVPVELARASVRFSLGRENTREQVDEVLEVLSVVLPRLLAANGLA